MYIVGIAWAFVVLLMTLTEATSTQGSLLGAFFTFILYGVVPLSVVLYILGTPARRRARLRAEVPSAAAGMEQPVTSAAPDGRSVPASDAVAPERKEA